VTQAPVAETLVWSFGSCSFDERRLELWVGGERVEVEARPLELLRHLLHHSGELVTKDELLEAVWPGRIPSESVLTKAVAKLRQALRDEDQAILRTIYGQGYRLVALVSVQTAEAAGPTEPAKMALQAQMRPPLRLNWVLQERLGATGRNEVWLARHDKTDHLRVFKFAPDAAGMRALKREITLYRVLRQTPGVDDHVLEVLDWNLDEPPYFVEYPYIAGGNLIHWIEQRAKDGNPCSLELRLELVAQIADTLAAAHDAGVLHKDVKPSNVLIDTDVAGHPRVHLADFGSGELVDIERLNRLEITRLGFTQTLLESDGSSSGTPLYFAPELLLGQRPSVRSDVYALGVLLYQAAVGDFRRPLAPGWERSVADELLCEDIAACADVDPARRLADARILANRLRTLDARRTAHAKLLAEREETERLRLRVERIQLLRPWLVSTAALLIVGLVSATTLWIRAERATQRAADEAAVSDAVNRFLTDDLLGGANPMQSGRRDISMADLLSRASQTVGQRFSSRPDVEAAVREAIGKAYSGLSDHDAGEKELRRAIALLDGRPDQKAAQDEMRLALIMLLLNAERTDLVPEQIALLEKRPPESPVALLRLRTVKAWLTLRAGNHEAAVAQFETQRPAYEALMKTDPALVVDFLSRLTEGYQLAGRIDKAIAIARDLLARETQLYGRNDARSIGARLLLGQTLMVADRNEESVKILTEARDLAQATLGEENELSLNVAGDLAGVYESLHRYAEAEAIYVRLVEIRLRRDGPDNLSTRLIQSNLALLYDNMGRSELALTRFRELYEVERRIGGESNPDTLTVAHQIAVCLSKLQRWQEALTWERRTFELARQALPADHWHLGLMQFKLAEILGHVGQREAALANFDESIAFLKKQLGEEHRWTQRAIALRAEVASPGNGSPAAAGR
jgi:serine/threonine protein kinase/DNA-binding winged helix-turn-helix (wHTH) protein